MQVIKKNGLLVDWDEGKIVNAVSKSCKRVGRSLTPEQLLHVTSEVYKNSYDCISVAELHTLVENALSVVDAEVAESYRSYRNYKTEFVGMLDNAFIKSKHLLYGQDRENSNCESTLNSTKQCLIRGYFTRELTRKFYLSPEELQAIDEGYIYIHDLKDMMFGVNCCLFDMATVLKGGFRMAGIQYTEPKTVLAALQVIGDITLAATSQNYGGYTISEIDKLLVPYVEKSYAKHKVDAAKWGIYDADKYAEAHVLEELRQGFQSFELKINTIPSSRGDTSFVTITFANLDKGNDTFKKWQTLICETIMNVRKEGHGIHKTPAVFPKLVYLYSVEQHKQESQQVLFDKAVECLQHSLFPDFLAIDTVGDVSEIYKRTGKVVSPMSCRAFLSDYVNEDGESVFVGRANIGVVSLNLPLIYQKSEGKNFWNDLELNMQLIRKFLKKRYNTISEQQCSTNPLSYCEGGFYGGNKRPEEKIGDLVRTFTSSFGITALNELNVLHEGKSLKDSDKVFVNKVVDYINARIDDFKKEDGYLYASYGSPAESLCGTQREQFVKMFGVVKGVSDKPYFSNSFHLHVTENVSMVEKQEHEHKLFHKIKGGRIQYVRLDCRDNKEAIKSVIQRGMELGLYQGINFNLCICNDCGHNHDNDGDNCLKCGSGNITTLSRVCGYISYLNQNGSTRFNEAKATEVKERRSM